MNTTSKSTNGNQAIIHFTTAVQVTDTSRLAEHSKLLTSVGHTLVVSTSQKHII